MAEATSGGGAGPVVVLLNRDLRVHDHPALTAAASLGRPVIPLFVLDERLLARPRSANRAAFLIESLADLRHSLQALGGQLYVRQGDPVAEAMKVVTGTNASSVYVTEDPTPLANRRQKRLEAACAAARVEFRTLPGTTVAPAGLLTPDGSDHYRVFTPYWNQWRLFPRRPIEPRPRHFYAPTRLSPGQLPAIGSVGAKPLSPDRATGGETAARRLSKRWLREHLASYPDNHDDLAADRTSRLSPYVHFGCLSVNELSYTAAGHEGGEPFIRQLCWRDFHHQVLAAFPALRTRDYRANPNRSWRNDPQLVDAWKEGRTGLPVVDAGMRQLVKEGWMPNRARLIAAAFLTRVGGVHWRVGADHFMDWLVDADVANNYGNWQWVAGTGNDTRPNRRFNLLRQALRFDPHGDYVRRHVPELAAIAGPAIHQPGKASFCAE